MGILLAGGQHGLRLLTPLHLFIDGRTVTVRRTLSTKNIIKGRTVIVAGYFPQRTLLETAYFTSERTTYEHIVVK